ncbi:ROK family protein [Cryptosporangium phraense]|uniref:ROK family protein n=1 Tax=Cryptosporangium phraense TaxID=2593070 RepID=A0A545AWZ9_9ACTN|nr:ROK family protein [Cryptosporangium phraense]TQS45859.1 ROK family protein [Cryptosporangium phraense]
MRPEVVLAADLGGTSLKYAIADATGAFVGPGADGAGACPTGRERGTEAVVETLLAVLESLRDRATAAGRVPVAVGVAVPGLVDEEAGIARHSVNLGWRDLPLRDRIEERLGLPVALANDVRAGGLAEAELAGLDDVLFVPVGTGIAAAQVRNGRVEAGAHGAAGELGHVLVRSGGRLCACGRRGCLEAEAAAAAIEARYAEVLAAPEPGSPLSGRPAADGAPVGGGAVGGVPVGGAPVGGAAVNGAPVRGAAGALGRPVVTAAEIARRAAAGEPRAVAVWQRAVEALADGLSIASAVLDPDVIVIGGGLAQAGRTLFVPLEAALAERATFLPRPRILPAALGDRAGCAGATLLARAASTHPTSTRTPGSR